jgi:hypothetical protein
MATLLWHYILSLALYSCQHCKMMLQQQTSMVGFRTRNVVQDLAGAADPVAVVVEAGVEAEAEAEAASQEVMMNMVAVAEASGLAAMIGQDLLEVEAFLMIGQGVEGLVVHSLLAEEEIGNHQLFWNDLKTRLGFC